MKESNKQINQNGTPKPVRKISTNLEKKVQQKIAKMTSNDSITMDFVLKNRKLLNCLKKCRVKLSKSIKSKVSKPATKSKKPPIKTARPTRNSTTKSTPSTSSAATALNKKSNSNSTTKQSPPSSDSPKIFIRLPRTNRNRNSRHHHHPIKNLLKPNLMKKFDRNLFKCHVRVRRLKDSDPLYTKKWNMSRKTVSFMETVEIFGESDIIYESESESEMIVDNGGDLEDESFVHDNETPSTSTPILNRSTRDRDSDSSLNQKNLSIDGKRCIVKLNKRAGRLDLKVLNTTNGVENNEIEKSSSVSESTGKEDNDAVVLENNADADMTNLEEKIEKSEEDSETAHNEIEATQSAEPKSIEENDEANSSSNSNLQNNENDLSTNSETNHEEAEESPETKERTNTTPEADSNNSEGNEPIISKSSSSKLPARENGKPQRSPTRSPTVTPPLPTEDLFDLLKTDQLSKVQRQPTPTRQILSEFSDSDDETNKVVLNSSVLDSQDSSNATNNTANDSRFSLNTFFKSVKDAILPTDRSPRNSPNAITNKKIITQ